LTKGTGVGEGIGEGVGDGLGVGDGNGVAVGGGVRTVATAETPFRMRVVNSSISVMNMTTAPMIAIGRRRVEM
jgi:hypothetical protein